MSDPDSEGVGQLAKKIAQVMAAIDSVPKNGRNDYHNYDYSTDDDVMQSVRPVMAEHNLIALPSVLDRSIERVSTGKKESDYQLHTQITLEVTLIDGDSGQSKTMTWEGEAQDGQDKGLYKALTSAMKYWALKTFLLSADADVETHNAAAGQARSNGIASHEPTQAQIEYAEDLAANSVWTDEETQALLNTRIPSADKNELSDLIEHMSKVVENGREVLE